VTKIKNVNFFLHLCVDNYDNTTCDGVLCRSSRRLWRRRRRRPSESSGILSCSGHHDEGGYGRSETDRPVSRTGSSIAHSCRSDKEEFKY